MKLSVKNTMWFSLLVQIITGILSLHGLFIILPEKDSILTDILGLETMVQFVEMVFYIWISYAMINVDKMTSRRYIDWVITTPTMLLSTIIFMKYQEEKEKEGDKVDFWGFMEENKKEILLMFAYNFCMLAFGFLGEVNVISKYISTPIGFYFFYKTFDLIYYKFAHATQLGKNLFTFMVSVWSLYGVAALMPVDIKNISYNLLDIVAKNFYGLYLYYKILQVSRGF